MKDIASAPPAATDTVPTPLVGTTVESNKKDTDAQEDTPPGEDTHMNGGW